MNGMNGLSFKEGCFFGADIRSGWGGSGKKRTELECDHHIKDTPTRFYDLVEVEKSNGAVVQNRYGLYQRLTIKSLDAEGVEVLLGGENNHMILAPGQSLNINVGSYLVDIRGTPDKGVIFNGRAPTEMATQASEDQRYPRKRYPMDRT